ncbi:hypothetical protein SBF1_150012 [Candidatus Desulfosporosinus infrequens]|uniref:Uncharacterized protein n=1 Tax=Candidatus Desulfosporosinus infrequens TaxID=2043169 RepID=A0A2U3K6Y0_9FIRM|nr:hypothetical protein SBF1_150012 [Candidatus Desulfosporosinus infrequens]
MAASRNAGLIDLDYHFHGHILFIHKKVFNETKNVTGEHCKC